MQKDKKLDSEQRNVATEVVDKLREVLSANFDGSCSVSVLTGIQTLLLETCHTVGLRCDQFSEWMDLTKKDYENIEKNLENKGE